MLAIQHVCTGKLSVFGPLFFRISCPAKQPPHFSRFADSAKCRSPGELGGLIPSFASSSGQAPCLRTGVLGTQAGYSVLCGADSCRWWRSSVVCDSWDCRVLRNCRNPSVAVQTPSRSIAPSAGTTACMSSCLTYAATLSYERLVEHQTKVKEFTPNRCPSAYRDR